MCIDTRVRLICDIPKDLSKEVFLKATNKFIKSQDYEAELRANIEPKFAALRNMICRRKQTPSSYMNFHASRMR